MNSMNASQWERKLKEANDQWRTSIIFAIFNIFIFVLLILTLFKAYLGEPSPSMIPTEYDDDNYIISKSDYAKLIGNLE